MRNERWPTFFHSAFRTPNSAFPTLRRRKARASPTSGRPRAASASVAGSGTSGTAVGTGTVVGVMLLSTLPSDVRCVLAVKSDSVSVAYCETAQKLPSPVPPLMLAPV